MVFMPGSSMLGLQGVACVCADARMLGDCGLSAVDSSMPCRPGLSTAGSQTGSGTCLSMQASELLLDCCADPNLTTISPVNKPHPRQDVIISGSSRSLYAWKPVEDGEAHANPPQAQHPPCCVPAWFCCCRLGP